MLHILVVDDSLIMRKRLNAILTELGHVVVSEAKNNEEAMSACDQFEIDLVTMDITMPGINGIGTTEDLLKKNPNMKIIMVTSHGQEDMVVNAIRAGALGYILKPITKDKMEEAIEKVINKSTDDDLDF